MTVETENSQFVAQFEHVCDQCGERLLAYRDCTGEAHTKCGRPMGNKIIYGIFKLVKKHDLEEAKKLGLTASWITNK